MVSDPNRFKPSVRKELARRVGYLCSNPGCRILTLGPSLEQEGKSIEIGEAAHIKAANSTGARYDPEMNSDERSDISNGIWLCRNCHRLIDRDIVGHPPEKLYSWKEKAEQDARNQVQCIGSSSELMHLSTVRLGLFGDLLTELIAVEERLIKLQRNARLRLISVKCAVGAIGAMQAELGFIVVDEEIRDAVEDYTLAVLDLDIFLQGIGIDPLTDTRFIDYHEGLRNVIRRDRKVRLGFLDLSRRLNATKWRQAQSIEVIKSIDDAVKEALDLHRTVMSWSSSAGLALEEKPNLH